MRFWVTKNPRVALMLIPWFVPVDQTRKEIYLELTHRLTYSPDETFVCLAVEDDLIKGLVIAYCRKNDVFIWQASKDKGVSPKVVDCVFEGIAYWAKGRGYNKITGYPNRAKKIWARRWGFQESVENKNEVFMEV